MAKLRDDPGQEPGRDRRHEWGRVQFHGEWQHGGAHGGGGGHGNSGSTERSRESRGLRGRLPGGPAGCRRRVDVELLLSQRQQDGPEYGIDVGDGGVSHAHHCRPV